MGELKLEDISWERMIRAVEKVCERLQITQQAYDEVIQQNATPVRNAIPVEDVPVAEIVSEDSPTQQPMVVPPPPASPGSSVPVIVIISVAAVFCFIALPVALLLPAVNAAREAARRTGCINNARQLGLAVMNHESATKRYPLAHDYRSSDADVGPQPFRPVADASPGDGKPTVLPP